MNKLEEIRARQRQLYELLAEIAPLLQRLVDMGDLGYNPAFAYEDRWRMHYAHILSNDARVLNYSVINHKEWLKSELKL